MYVYFKIDKLDFKSLTFAHTDATPCKSKHHQQICITKKG